MAETTKFSVADPQQDVGAASARGVAGFIGKFTVLGGASRELWLTFLIKFLICDTAGRLHTKSNLMAELAKVKRSLAKQNEKAPDETLLVVDATTGSNALSQAREFHQAIGLTGLIVTKLDGSGKGGIVIAIQDELGLPTRFVGTGEKLEDLAPFDGRDFVANMM